MKAIIYGVLLTFFVTTFAYAENNTEQTDELELRISFNGENWTHSASHVTSLMTVKLIKLQLEPNTDEAIDVLESLKIEASYICSTSSGNSIDRNRPILYINTLECGSPIFEELEQISEIKKSSPKWLLKFGKWLEDNLPELELPY